MDRVGMSMGSVKGGYTGFRKLQLEPLLATLLEDPLLADVPRKRPTLKELETLIGVEKGSAMMLSVKKLDDTAFDVAILNNASVGDLKAAVQKKVNAMEAGQMGHRHISWKHVWGNFCLVYNGEKLLNEKSSLNDFGVKNGDELHFAHHLMSREGGYHSRAKKRRFFHGLRKDVNLDRLAVQKTK